MALERSQASSSASTVTARALSALAAFEHSAGALSVARIAQRANLPPSTTYRLVHELEEWGALDKTPDGKYQVGMRLWELGQLAGRRLRDRARPFLQDLFDLTHENIHIAVREGTQTLYVDKIYGSKKMPLISRVGGRLPMHATAVGRVLLADQPDWFIDAYLSRELEAPTQMTETDPKKLREEIEVVRAQGYSLTIEQMRVGQCSIALPIVGEGNALAAIGMVLDKGKILETKRLVPLLRGTAERIESAMLGPSLH